MRRLRDLSPGLKLALVVITFGGAGLRFWFQWGRPFTGDEVGTLYWMKRDYGFILSNFIDPWLSMNVFIAMTKALGTLSSWNPWVMNLPSLAAGVVVVPLVAAVGVRVASPSVALMAATLAAANPYLLFYAVQLRAYALLLVGVLVALIGFLDWQRTERTRDGVWCAAGMTLACVMHSNAIYFAAALAVLGVTWWYRDPRPWRQRLGAARTLLGPLVVAAVVVVAIYLPVIGPMRAYSVRNAAVPPTTLAWVPYALREYFGAGFLVLPSLALAALGARAAAGVEPRLRAIVVAVVVPVIAASWVGLSAFPWAMARYLLVVLPPLLILVAAGVTTLPRRARAIALLVIVATWIPAIARLDADKRARPWARVGAHLARTTRAGDVLLATDVGYMHTALDTGPYLPANGATYDTPSTYLGGSGPGRLVVVNAVDPIASTAHERRFHRIQVLRYGGGSRVDVATRVLHDLERWLGDRIDPTLVGGYQLVLDLRTALGLGDPDGRYARAYYECRMRTRQQRFMPPQLLGVDG
ncbi:MAG TPA: glycosyltransferase family 39 protein [Candidatus Binatia bacterium]|nr:glycosyltransferase family 39 protein [Candidatus Binatia bacterium]